MRSGGSPFAPRPCIRDALQNASPNYFTEFRLLMWNSADDKQGPPLFVLSQLCVTKYGHCKLFRRGSVEVVETALCLTIAGCLSKVKTALL